MLGLALYALPVLFCSTVSYGFERKEGDLDTYY
ncbi:MAG: hypothetical protein Greene071421_76 [Parcubacteria group bacterium Greene0714_21]|nr:MAG: hypothetical protein Greene041639_527 [Parcubacteria group bacterium Greene0416_39]TSC97766.1 MAG: hypothetical protein Greene101447_302 [Parcubacteria group bacterium Greene1014_47]TSD04240.1 MAG: hypothetical protein Greene071421_76 [Parcubacteria group bacterium Greene0714_21]